MNELIIAALVAILSVQPNLTMERIEPIRTIVSQTATQTVESVLLGDAVCETTWLGDVAQSWRVKHIRYSDTTNLAHELAHGVDCMDNGKVDGSLLPYKPTSHDPGHEFVYWCLANEAECIARMEATR
jgi:hypothetical protein